MGEMLNKIETMNNTIFTLQSEMNDIKRQGPKQPSSVHTEMPLRIPSNVYPPDMTETHMARNPSSIPPPIITRQSTPVEAPSLETFEDQIVETPKEELYIERSRDFFEEEDAIDIDSFKQELEEEAKLSATNNNMLSQKTQQQTPSPGSIQPIVQPVPVVQPVPSVPVAQPVSHMVVQPPLPTAQITKPVQVYSPPVVQQQIVQQTEKGNNDDKDNIDISKNENIISDSKTFEEKNDNNFVTPTNEQLKLSKKIGIHKKAVHRNIKPSFKKSDGEENKEENNI